MKSTLKTSSLFLLILSLFLIYSCKKDKPSPPTITTAVVTAVSYTTAVSGGNVTSEGGAPVTTRGICWNTSADPTIANNIKAESGTQGSFASNITQLTPNTMYYVKAYATNSGGTSYGDQVTFTTNQLAVPVLTTTDAKSITQTSAVLGGNITDDKGGSITARGVCWSTSTNPTISDSKTSNGTGIGVFSSSLTGLIANTIYHVRAYATNSIGTSYGNELILKTYTGSVTDIDGNVYNTITIGTQEWMLENLKVMHYNNNDPIPNVTDDNAWIALKTGAYCDYNNIPDSSKIYGKLYNFYAVADARNLCPTGWHVPSDAEWTILTDFLGGTSVAGGKMKESGLVHWWILNTGATNESGFTALPGGYRTYVSGMSIAIKSYAGWWTSTENSTGYSWYRGVRNSVTELSFDIASNANGQSVRCIKNN